MEMRTQYLSAHCVFELVRVVFKNNNKKEGRKEGNILFNDALNTFYLPLYGIRHGKEPHR